MRIENSKGEPITDLAEWARLYDSPQTSHQWKEGYSAHSAAVFALEQSGCDSVRKRVSEVIGTSIEIDRAVPEYEVRFDKFGHGRMHDIAMFGWTAEGKSLFIGVEAKVNETFGATVRDAYLAYKAKQIAGESTNAPVRMEQLLAMHFHKPDVSMFDVRYQLLYATAGTLTADADISILFVAVFKTSVYDETVGAENYRDYAHFMGKVGAISLKLPSKEVQGHELFLHGKKLVCLHEYFEI